MSNVCYDYGAQVASFEAFEEAHQKARRSCDLADYGYCLPTYRHGFE